MYNAERMIRNHLASDRVGSLQASEVCELQNTVYNVQQQLEKSDERRTAAEAAVIELVPLHLTVSQLRQRLAAEMTALHELQVATLKPSNLPRSGIL